MRETKPFWFRKLGWEECKLILILICIVMVLFYLAGGSITGCAIIGAYNVFLLSLVYYVNWLTGFIFWGICALGTLIYILIRII